MKKIIALLLSAALLCGALGLSACGPGGAKRDPELAAYDADDTKIKLDTTDYATQYPADYTAYPRSEGRPQKTIQVLDITGCDGQTLLLTMALQGVVNRRDPSLWLISGFIVQGLATFKATEFWLKALDTTYLDENGDPYFVKERHTDVDEMILHYRDKLAGAVLYESRIADRMPMCNQYENNSIYGDMAVLNLTAMMAGQYAALPLTESRLAALNRYLKENGAEELPVLADSREFMPKNADGSLSPDRSSREVWQNVYDYALKQAASGAWQFSDAAISHNGTFNGAHYDYGISQKMFFYNRILDPEATPEEKATENKIYSLTRENTPVTGVWHLVAADEENCVMACNRAGKFFLVTYDTLNISFTSAFETVEAKGRDDEKLVYDDSKVYVAVTLSESDNNSYTFFKMMTQYMVEERGSFPMTWALNQGVLDLNPNIIAYMNATMAEGDGFATGESGPGYVRLNSVVDEQKANFYGLASRNAAYLNGSIRTLVNDRVTAMDYALYTKNLTSVLSGYGAGHMGTDEYNSGKNNFFFHDKPIFQTISQIYDLSILNSFKCEPGSFYSVGLAGWETDLATIYESVRNLPENFVMVTQKQLADLYTQKMYARFHDVTGADFETAMTVDELGYLFYSDNFANFSEAAVAGAESYRYGEKDNYCVYKFDLDEQVKDATFSLDLAGEYVVKLSTDCENWTAVALHHVDTANYDRAPASFRLPESMAGKTVYLKISDPTPEDASGFRFYGLSMLTDRAALERAVEFSTDADDAYFVSGAGRGASGYRSGEVVYRAPVSAAFKSLGVAVAATEDVSVAISLDGSRYYPCEVNKYTAADGTTAVFAAYVDSAAPGLTVKLSSPGEIRSVRLTPVGTVEEFSVSLCGNDFERNHLLTGSGLQRTTAGTSSNVRIANDGVLTYVFRLSEKNASPMLELFAGGLFKLEISADGKNFKTLKSVAAGENITDPLIFDISDTAKPGGIFYVRLTKSTTVSGQAAVYWLSLING